MSCDKVETMACYCEPKQETACCAACEKRNECNDACAIYAGWDELECRDETSRRNQLEERQLFIDAT